jgi:hypothetical protein
LVLASERRDHHEDGRAYDAAVSFLVDAAKVIAATTLKAVAARPGLRSLHHPPQIGADFAFLFKLTRFGGGLA